MNQKMCIAIVLVIAMFLCLTSALPTYGGLSYGFGQQRYPRGGYRGYGYNPYSGSIGGIGSSDPVFSNGFGSEYGSRFGSYGAYGGYSPYRPYYNNRYGDYGNQYGGGIAGGFQP